MTTSPNKTKPARGVLAGAKRAGLQRPLAAHENGRCRIVLTGGPGGGKTTAADLFRREIGERVVIVPEAATLIFSGGFPRCTGRSGILAAQHAIFHVQRNLENVQSSLVVRHNPSFFKKISFGLAELDAMVAELDARRSGTPAKKATRHPKTP